MTWSRRELSLHFGLQKGRVVKPICMKRDTAESFMFFMCTCQECEYMCIYIYISYCCYMIPGMFMYKTKKHLSIRIMRCTGGWYIIYDVNIKLHQVENRTMWTHIPIIFYSKQWCCEFMFVETCAMSFVVAWYSMCVCMTNKRIYWWGFSTREGLFAATCTLDGGWHLPYKSMTQCVFHASGFPSIL